MNESDWDRRARREREWLESLGPVDSVAYYGGSWSKPHIVPVARVTSTQIVLGNGTRFWRKNGRSVGGSGSYSRPSITELTDDLRRDIWRNHVANELANVQWEKLSDGTLAEALKAVRNDEAQSGTTEPRAAEPSNP